MEFKIIIGFCVLEFHPGGEFGFDGVNGALNCTPCSPADTLNGGKKH